MAKASELKRGMVVDIDGVPHAVKQVDQVPEYLEAGERVKVNTETGKYMSRA